MDYVMDAVRGLDVEELIVITGHLKEVVQRYIVEHYPGKARFGEQKTLFEGIAHVLRQPPGKGGEFYLTDAFQYMVDHGRRLLTAPVRGWYDCGKVDTLLETNRHLLDQGRARIPAGPCPRCTIVPPVYIEDGVTIHDATVGPNVSLEAGSYVTESTIANSILGRNVRVVRGAVRDSLIGDDQVIEGKSIARSVLDAGELVPAP